MRVLLFGATGMVGQGVLRECLEAPDVEAVHTIGRATTGRQHAKLHEIVHGNMRDFSTIEPALSNFDACFFCLGISSFGMSEEDYSRITYDIAIAAAGTLACLNPRMTFIFVSGAGADSTESGSVMWARIKGKTENAILRLPFRQVYVFRPGFIQPVHGARSKTTAYRLIYGLVKPITPLLRALFPNAVLTTQEIGQAMLLIARHEPPKAVLEARDIRQLLQTWA